MKSWAVVMERHSMDWEREKEFKKEPCFVVRRFWTKWRAERYAYNVLGRPGAVASMASGESSTDWFERPRAQVRRIEDLSCRSTT